MTSIVVPAKSSKAFGLVALALACALFVFVGLFATSPAVAHASETEPPTIPSNVVAVPGAAAPTIATVTWDASTDNVMVLGYRVWRAVSAGGTPVLLGSTAGLNFADTSGVPGQTYYYRVSAYDSSGNESAKSDPAVGPVSATWTQAPHATYGVDGKMCQLCHVPHVAETENALLRETGGTPGEVGVCYACHDGQGANANIATGPDNSFALASGHDLEQAGPTGDLTDACSGCHAPHVDYTTNALLPRTTINGTAVAGADNTWCLACHNNTNDWYGAGYPSLASPTRDATGYPTLGTFPGRTIYSASSANAHGSIEASAAADREVGDCLYCHESHRAGNGYDGLLETYRPTTAATLADDQANGTYAESCFDCHGGETGIWFVAPGPTGAENIKQFATAATTRAGHRIKTAGGTLPVGAPLPCYDCHNPHGSARGNKQLLADTLGQSLETSTQPAGAHLVREFCFTCHSSSDDQVWNSVSAAYEGAGTDSVEGLRRDGSLPAGNVLKLPVVNGHDSGDAQSCYMCHGSSYAPGGNNVHNPSGGVSQGGEACYNCHSAYQNYMEDGTAPKIGANRTSAYHHVLGGNMDGGATYYDGDYAPGTNPYPTLDIFTPGIPFYCVTCHVDHDKFNANQAANLRQGSSAIATNTDFSSVLPAYGLCTNCHGLPMPKDTVNQKSDGTNLAQSVSPGKYNVSAHQYEVKSTYGDSSQFRANCSKCHTDEQTKDFQTSSAKFGTHWSAARRLISAFGVTVTDPLQEKHCYGCHSTSGAYSGAKTVVGKDYYGAAGASMDTTSEVVWAQFQLASKHPVAASATGSVECENCHNPHNVTKTSRVSNPDNTLNLMAYGTTAERAAFCLKCHDGAVPVYASTPTTYTPYTVTMTAIKMNKSTYTARGHWTANGSISAAEAVSCASCHDNHGSNAKKLLGVYDPATGKNYIGTREMTTTTSPDVACYGCHQNSSTSYPAASRLASGYPQDGTWPGESIYTSATLNGHSEWTCVYFCHDPHGAANTYDQLLNTYTETNFAACLFCHGPLFPDLGDIGQYYPPSAGGTSVSATSGHRTVSAGTLPAGSAVPCYDCHNPHGSVSPSMLLVVTRSAGTTIVVGDASGEITMTTPAGVRQFCFACHTTGDPGVTSGWNGSAMAPVTAPAMVEGIDRTTYAASGAHLKLPPVTGHYMADTTSCYQCHGNSYIGATSNNVHNPSNGVSTGGVSCNQCHEALNGMVDDTSQYHHVLDLEPTATAPFQAPNGGSYPTSKTDLACVSCHVDHNEFSALPGGSGKAMSLRTNATLGSVVPTSTDLPLCLSCHTGELARNTTGQKSNIITETAVWSIDATWYAASPHNYDAPGPFDDGSVFRANCAKCHGSLEGTLLSGKFATHFSPEQRLLNALGDAVIPNVNEEQMCFRCHSHQGDSLAGTKKPTDGFDWYGTQPMSEANEAIYSAMHSGLTYGHKPHSYSNIHLVSSTDETQIYISANKHVECADCHNHHVVGDARHEWGTTNAVSEAIRGVSGQGFNYVALNTVSRPTTAQVNAQLSWKTNSDYEYEICFKCHSSANTNLLAWGGSKVSTTTQPAWTNVAVDFNPANQSKHPVLRPNTPDATYLDTTTYGTSRVFPSQLDTSTWAPGDTMYCSDCHGDSTAPALGDPDNANHAQGPHGSDVQYSLRGPNTAWPINPLTSQPFTLQDAIDGDKPFCSNCHPNVAGNKVHARNPNHKAAYCINCHTLVPHGGGMSRLIGDGDGAMPARYAYNNDKSTMYVASYIKRSDPNTYVKADCRVTVAGCTVSSGHTMGSVITDPYENW